MGNSLSYQNTNSNNEESGNREEIKSINKDNLVDLIDKIATDFVLQQNMLDMIRFTDKSYYDKLIILTSSIMKKELTDLELGILQDRVLHSVNHNTNNINNEDNMQNNMQNNHIYFTNSDQLQRISLIGEKEKQKALYLISKFYIKIMTVFSAITSIIDPQYVYEGNDGKKKYFHLKDFNDFAMVDKELDTIRLDQLYNPMSFVRKRLNILKNKMNDANENSELITINPGEIFCESNDSLNVSKTEIGIKELDALYFDEFDYDTKSWGKMSSSMKKKYERDLTKFYQIFTGKKTRPSSVATFHDIESLEFHKLYRCQTKEFYRDVIVSKSDKLFLKYLRKINEIDEISSSYKKKLLHLLKSIFVERVDDGSIMIHPELTLDKILVLQEQTKDCILNIFTNCEKLFIEALLIYEELFDSKFGALQENRLQNIYQYQENQLNNVDQLNEVNEVNSITQNNVDEKESNKPLMNIPMSNNVIQGNVVNEQPSAELNSDLLSYPEANPSQDINPPQVPVQQNYDNITYPQQTFQNQVQQPNVNGIANSYPNQISLQNPGQQLNVQQNTGKVVPIPQQPVSSNLNLVPAQNGVNPPMSQPYTSVTEQSVAQQQNIEPVPNVQQNQSFQNQQYNQSKIPTTFMAQNSFAPKLLSKPTVQNNLMTNDLQNEEKEEEDKKEGENTEQKDNSFFSSFFSSKPASNADKVSEQKNNEEKRQETESKPSFMNSFTTMFESKSPENLNENGEEEKAVKESVSNQNTNQLQTETNEERNRVPESSFSQNNSNILPETQSMNNPGLSNLNNQESANVESIPSVNKIPINSMRNNRISMNMSNSNSSGNIQPIKYINGQNQLETNENSAIIQKQDMRNNGPSQQGGDLEKIKNDILGILGA